MVSPLSLVSLSVEIFQSETPKKHSRQFMPNNHGKLSRVRSPEPIKCSRDMASSTVSKTKMPLHQIYTPRGFYTAEEKATLAAAITDAYNSVIPVGPIAKLLVEVQYFELDKVDRFVSGEANDTQVQFRVSHVARHYT